MLRRTDLISSKDEKTMEWLSNHRLFLSELQGGRPDINLAEAKSRLLNRIATLDTSSQDGPLKKADLELK